MKLAIHCSWPIESGTIGGTERFVLNLAKGLNKKEIETYIIAANRKSELEVEGVKVFGKLPTWVKKPVNEHFYKRYIIGDKFTMRSIERFSQFVAEQLSFFNYDLLQVNAFLYGINLKTKVKTIVTNHENPDEFDNYWGTGAFAVFKEYVKNIDCSHRLIVPSRYYSNLFSQEFNKKVEPIPLGIDLIDFPIKTRKKKTRLNILFPARFSIMQKGQDIAVEALRILKEQGIEFSCTFSGYDMDTYPDDIKIIQRKISEYNLEENVHLKKYDDMLNAYYLHNMVLSCEKYCSFGLSISESLALGMQTILPSIPTYLEIALGYSHAHFFNIDSIDDLVKTIISAKDSPVEIDDIYRFRQKNNFNNAIEKYYNLLL